MLIITPLVDAFQSLKKALRRSEQPPKDLEIRDACIQRFEYTYELSIKMIKRYLDQEMPITENIDQLNYRDLLRIAYEGGLITEVKQWFIYREVRNQTSHAYNAKKAISVYQILPEFIESAGYLINQLKQRLTS